MNEAFNPIDWSQIIYTIWTVILLPTVAYIGTQIGNYIKAKQIDKYTNILYQNVSDAVKDVYETIVKDIKNNPDLWTAEKQDEVKTIAKTKAVQALSCSAYQILTTATENFEEYLDSLVGAVLYDLKHNT